jgi:acyl-CoA reductase-like NAD-dependent aldehyde dehydrogenase
MLSDTTDFDDLPKQIQYAHYIDLGYSTSEAAEKAGYAGRPPKGARQLADILDPDTPTEVEVSVETNDDVVDACREALLEAKKQEQRLAWQKKQAARRRKVLRARLETVRECDDAE